MEADAEIWTFWPPSRVMKMTLVFADGPTLYALVSVAFALLGLFVSPFFFAFHLADIFHRSQTLQVRRSVLCRRCEPVVVVALARSLWAVP